MLKLKSLLLTSSLLLGGCLSASASEQITEQAEELYLPPELWVQVLSNIEDPVHKRNFHIQNLKTLVNLKTVSKNFYDALNTAFENHNYIHFNSATATKYPYNRTVLLENVINFIKGMKFNSLKIENFNNFDTESDFEKLSSLNKIKKIDLSNITRNISSNLARKEIAGQSEIFGFIFTNLAKLKNLEAINLSSSVFSRWRGVNLSQMTQLRTLNLSFGSDPASEDWREIGKITSLKTLDLSGNSLVKEDFEEIAKMTNLEDLDISYNNKRDSETVNGLAVEIH